MSEELPYQFLPVTSTDIGDASAPYIEDVVTDMNQVGNTSLTDDAFQAQMAGIRADYAISLADINARFSVLSDQILEAQTGIMSQISENAALNQSSYETLINEFQGQVTSIRNVQQLQVQTAAAQLDAMMGSGQFGGNIYRSQQVYSANMTNIITESMGLVAEITLQYRAAAETQLLTFSHEQLSAYITGVSAILSANTDLAKSYALVRSDMTSNKNTQLNQIFSLKVQYDIAEQDRISSEKIAEQSLEAQKLMTQWRIDADLQMAEMDMEIANKQIDAQLLIAERNNEISIKLETMRIESAETIAQWSNDLALKLQAGQISSQEYIQSMNNQAQVEAGLQSYEQQMAMYQAEMAQQNEWFNQGLDVLQQNTQSEYDSVMSQYDADSFASDLEIQQYVEVTATEIMNSTGASLSLW